MRQASFGQRLVAVTSNLSNLVVIANACDKAYCEGTRNAYGPHVPFDVVSKPEMVAQNIAGVQAVMTGISMIALINIEEPNEEILRRISKGDLDPLEEGLLLRAANCAWGAGQPFRSDKGLLGRATKLNFFNDLPEEEVRKDLFQIRAAATALLAMLD